MKRLFCLVCVLLYSTAVRAQSQDAAHQIQTLLSHPKNSAALGQAMAVGSILTCTQQKVGKEATSAFYKEMNDVGQSIAQYCKEGHATEARSTLLATLKSNHDNAVYQAAVTCYDTQAANIRIMAGSKFSTRADQYYTWAKDVSAAEKTMQESDICKPKAH